MTAVLSQFIPLLIRKSLQHIRIIPKRHPLFLTFYLWTIFLSCSPQTFASTIHLPSKHICLHLVTDLLQNPVALAEVPDTGFFYVAERDGTVQVIDANETPAASNPDVVLDITERVMSKGDHMGILGMAVHPKIRTNGFVFLMYSAESDDREFHHRQVVSRFSLFSVNGTEINKFSETVILEIYQSGPTSGQIWFGSEDQALYIGVGDGSRARRRRFDRGSHNGKILRINVDVDLERDGRVPYKIPSDNPFAHQPSTLLPEVFAYGLQNPWRCSEEKRENKKGNQQTRIVCIDVGAKFSDFDIIHKGGMYGWLDEAFSPCHDLESCRNTTKLKPEFKLPICRYPGIAVGGFFFQPWNSYLFADYLRGTLHYLKPSHSSAMNSWLRGNVEVVSNGSCSPGYATLAHQTVLNLVQFSDRQPFLLAASNEHGADEPNGHLYRVSVPKHTVSAKAVRSTAPKLLFSFWFLTLVFSIAIDGLW